MHPATSKFLIDVFGPSTEAPVYFSSLTNSDAPKGPERHLISREFEDIETWLNRWDRPDRGSYFTVSTVGQAAGERSLDTIREMVGLHADIDFKNITATPDEVDRKLKEIQLPPSKVINSGHGRHAYWLFREKLEATPENIEHVKALLRLLKDHVGGDPMVCHPAALMRLPGTHNTKFGERIEVTEIVDNPAARYDIDELEEWLATVSPIIQHKPKQTNGANGHDPETNPWLAAAGLFSHRAPIDVEQRLAAMAFGAGENGIHATQVSVTAALLNRGTPIDEVVEIVLAATCAAAGAFGECWKWRREERAVRDMCTTWIEKHPEIFPKPDDRNTNAPQVLWTYQGREFTTIPHRHWLHAGHYIRGQVVMTIAPGGYGKTSLVLCNAIEMVTGRGLLGPPPTGGSVRVAYWNAEDPDEEIERRIAAICIRYGIDPKSLKGDLFLGSTLKGGRRLATIDRQGNVSFDDKLLTEIEQIIMANQIECLILDPLIAFHAVPESDNVSMEKVIKSGIGGLAERTNCCIELSQHTRKSTQGQTGELTADDSRGAGAIVNACRSVRVLNRMTESEAEMAKIEPEERRHYLRVSRDKTNLAPPGKATWIRLVPVELPNGEAGRPGDKVQAVEPWDHPQPFDNVTADDMRWMRDCVRDGDYRRDVRSADWVGRPLAQRLGLDPDDKGDRKRLGTILNAWFANGALATEIRKDDQRKKREFVVPGTWNNNAA
jgi:AAA domain